MYVCMYVHSVRTEYVLEYTCTSVNRIQINVTPLRQSVYTDGVGGRRHTTGQDTPRLPHPTHRRSSLPPLAGGSHRRATVRSELSPFGKVPSPTRRAGLPSPLWQRLGQVFQRVVRVGSLRERASAWAGVGESGGLTYASSERLDVHVEWAGVRPQQTVAPLAGAGQLAGTQRTLDVVVWPLAT